MIGKTLGPYLVVAKLGEGGMGEVYRATDTRLDRQVAIKVLPGIVASSPEARQRFDREAKAISKLSHRHVCALFDVGREGEIDYLVMELLEGQTLANRLAGGAMPWEDVVRIGTEIAQALAAAHAQGIVHRDLKPGNVMLTAGGVKLLDFGLAKAASPTMMAGTDADTPTATGVEPLTAHGQWLGTAGYMSPEQLQGQTADARSDVFALGLILFEMMTRRRPFGGDTIIAAASGTLHGTTPTFASLGVIAPPGFERLVDACLVKDPAARWQSAHDAALTLSTLGKEAVTREGPQDRARAPSVLARSVPWAVALVATLTAIGVWTGKPVPTDMSRPPLTMDLRAPDNERFLFWVEAVQFAVSPDGTALAFVSRDAAGRRQIWIRPLDSIDAKAIAGTDDATTVFWSPDGQSIGFFTGALLKRLDLASGAVVDLAPIRTGIGYTATWGADTIVYSSIEGDNIYGVPVGGGDPFSLAKPDIDRGESRLIFPLFLPDGRRFLYLQRRRDGTQFLMVADPGRPPQQIMPVESNVQFLAPDVLVYAQNGALVGRAFDAATGRTTGETFPVADSVNFFLTTGVAAFSASAQGTLVYQAHRDLTRLAWVDRLGSELGRVGTPGAFLDLRLSADDRMAMFSRGLPQTGTYDVWSLDLARNVEQRITSDDRATEISPVSLADGITVIFSKAVGNAPRLTRKVIGGADEVQLSQGTRLQTASDVSPDGRWVAYHERSERGDSDIWLMPVDGSAPPHPVQNSPASEADLRFSPDGRLYSFLSNRTGTQQLYVASMEGGTGVVVSSGGALRGRWSPRGRELLYQTLDNRLISLPVVEASARASDTQTTLFAFSSHAWVDFAVSADGARFLAAIPEVLARDEPLTTVIGWRSPVR